MGFIADAFRLGSTKAAAVASTVTPYDVGFGRTPSTSYDHNAREGYMVDELVYECIDVRANAAGEPPVVAWRRTASGEEKVDTPDESPAIALLKRPNPFMSAARFWATVVMHLDVGGNAYI